MRFNVKPMAGVGGIIVALLVLLTVVGWYWSAEPRTFTVQSLLVPEGIASEPLAPGQVSTLTLVKIVETLWDKPGGYVSNDVSPPGILMDNMPSWEFGVLVQARDFARALRKDMSRSQSQSAENKSLAQAEPRLNYDSEKWIFESAESQYKDSAKHLLSYYESLSDGGNTQGQFYARADNLRIWLADVETRLGSLSQRLSASVGRSALDVDAGDSQQGDKEMQYQTPWLEVDNVFYEARGSAWALMHLLNAVAVDFKSVLEKKNALVSLKQIVRELEGTQQSLFSPVVLNGSGMGILANHSLVMANYISRANAAIIDLRELLAQG